MRLIDADELKNDHKMGDECDKCETKWRECQYDYIYSKMDFCTWIDDAPTVDAVEVVHGTWVHEFGGFVNCSECGASPLLDGEREYVETNYCPNCGARMDGEVKNDD